MKSPDDTDEPRDEDGPTSDEGAGLPSTSGVPPTAGSEAYAAMMSTPLHDSASTLRLSPKDHGAAAAQAPIPFRGADGNAPPRLTPAERAALEAENMTGTVALTGASADALQRSLEAKLGGAAPVAPGRSATRAAPSPEVRRPEPPAPAPAVSLEPARSVPSEARGSSSPQATPDAPLADRARPLKGVRRSHQASRTAARLLSELAVTEDGDLGRFRTRRVSSEIDAESMAYLRDILGGIMGLLEHAAEDDAKSIKQAWLALFPAIRRALTDDDG